MSLKEGEDVKEGAMTYFMRGVAFNMSNQTSPSTSLKALY